jgi:hypothetical protein
MPVTQPRPPDTNARSRIRAVASCRCHPDVIAGPCPRCGGRAIGWLNRPGTVRNWHAPDRPEWHCSDCGAHGWSLVELRGAA